MDHKAQVVSAEGCCRHEDCILAKKAFPDMIAGFGFAGQESAGESLESLTPSLIWFEEECFKEGLEI